MLGPVTSSQESSPFTAMEDVKRSYDDGHG